MKSRFVPSPTKEGRYSPNRTKTMKLKICGMKLNTAEVAATRPDYLGFIFWKNSSRFFDGEIPAMPDGIKKIGVFVDASIEEIMDKVAKYDLQGVQLHGSESPQFCKELRLSHSDSETSQDVVRSSTPEVSGETSRPSTTIAKTKLKIIKVFSIKDTFDFNILEPYEAVCDYFLFDTKGELPGGNGYAFDWEVLANYPSTKPYFLSGGIGLEDVEAIKNLIQRPESKHCHAIDVNSRFEIEPGLKEVGKLSEFKKLL